MAIESIATDIAVTWLGAAGCGYFLWQLRRSDDRREHRALSFLVAVLTLLLAVRGFAWWTELGWLKRGVQIIASLLPLAATLFCEQILRRHHPSWLKWLALATSVVFVAINLFGFGLASTTALYAFMVCFAIVIVANGLYLAAADSARLRATEVQLARTLVVVAVLSVPLLLSDFRTLHQQVPVRLGAIGALLFVHVMLGASAQQIQRLPQRLIGWLLAAVALAGVFTVIAGGDRIMMLERFWHFLPVAYAWMLLAAIVVLGRSVVAGNRDHEFLRWFADAPLSSRDALVTALRQYSPTADHLILRADDLREYDLERLWSSVSNPAAPVSIGWARMQAREAGAGSADAAEQWLDMLERHQMTHALPVSCESPLIILLNLPVASGSITELRLRAILNLARSLEPSRP